MRKSSPRDLEFFNSRTSLRAMDRTRPVPAISSLWCTVRLRCPVIFVFSTDGIFGENLGIWRKKQWDDLGFRIQKLRKLWDFQTHSCGLATTHADLTHEDLVVDHRLKPELPPKKIAIAFLEGVRSTSFVVSSTSSKGFAWMKPSFFWGVANYLSHIYIYRFQPFACQCPVFVGQFMGSEKVRLEMTGEVGQIWGCRFRAKAPNR